MYSYLFFAILSAIFGALANILAKPLTIETEPKDILSINFLLMAGVLVVFAPFSFHIDLGIKTLILVLLTACIDLVGNYFYFKSFENSEVSIVTPILCLSPGFTFVLSAFLLRESTSIIQITLATTIIIGTIWIALNGDAKEHLLGNGKVYAFVAAGFFGCSAIPSKYLLTNNLINAPTLFGIRCLLISFFSIMIFRPKISDLFGKSFTLAFNRGLLVIAQWLLLYYALKLGNAGITMTLSNTTPIFVFIFSFILLKEPLSFKKFSTASLVIILSFALALGFGKP